MSLLRTRWATAPLGRVAKLNARTLPETTDPGFEFRYIDIGSVGRGTLIEEPQTLTFENAPSRARRILRPGDTIVSTVRTYLRAVMRVPDDAKNLIGSTGFAVLTARPQLDSRFLSWFSQSDPFIEEVVAQSVGVSYPAISPSDLARLPVPMPDLPAQRAIANFLDAETARIDALIIKKRSLASVLDERFRRVVSREIWEKATSRKIALKRLVGLPTSGNRDHGSFTDSEEGVPCLRGLNVRAGKIDKRSLLRISDLRHAQLRATQLSEGDIVIVRSGLAGVAAVVPPDLNNSNCVDLVILHRSTTVNPYWLQYVINSEVAQTQVAKNHAGALLQHFNAVDAGELRIPYVPISKQREAAARLDEHAGRHEQLTSKLTCQTALLTEHRQALITSAVTGEMEVPGTTTIA